MFEVVIFSRVASFFSLQRISRKYSKKKISDSLIQENFLNFIKGDTNEYVQYIYFNHEFKIASKQGQKLSEKKSKLKQGLNENKKKEY